MLEQLHFSGQPLTPWYSHVCWVCLFNLRHHMLCNGCSPKLKKGVKCQTGSTFWYFIKTGCTFFSEILLDHAQREKILNYCEIIKVSSYWAFT